MIDYYAKDQATDYEPDYEDYEREFESVCVCPEYFGTTKVTYCKACGDWTDNIEIAMTEAAETAATPRKLPAVAYTVYRSEVA